MSDSTAQPPIDMAVSAYRLLQQALKDDPEYAWAWHCNIAMPIMDEAHVSHEVANRTAAHLMRHLFGIDITKNNFWQYGVQHGIDGGTCPLVGCTTRGPHEHEAVGPHEGQFG